MVPVLDHGHVRLVSVMGDDLAVVNDARVSFDKRSRWDDNVEKAGEWGNKLSIKRLKPEDVRLINYLARNDHWSPFSHSILKFEVKAPMLVKNQWIKHRIGMSYLTDEDAEAWDNEGWNEMSLRYVEPNDFYVPTEWRAAPENKKQGSGENVNWSLAAVRTKRLRDSIEEALGEYRLAIARGIAPEQARVYLPMYAMYTSYIWTTSLYGVIRFLTLREKPDAQYEIRQYADAVHQLTEPHFPETFRAFGLAGNTEGA